MNNLVDFEVAKQLKELGFNEPTLHYRQKSAVIGDSTILPLAEGEEPYDWNSYGKEVPYYSIPTKKQATEFLRRNGES